MFLAYLPLFLALQSTITMMPPYTSALRLSSTLGFAFFTPVAAAAATSFTAGITPLCRRPTPFFHYKNCISLPFDNTTHRSIQMTVSTTPSEKPAVEVTGPAWELEYDGLDAPNLLADVATAERLTEDVTQAGKTLHDFIPKATDLSLADAKSKDLPSTVVAMTKQYWEAVILLRNVATQAGCVASCDGTNAAAKKMTASMQVRFAKLRQAYEPAALFLDLCTDEVFEAVLAAGDDEMRAAEYILRHSRKMRDHKLSLNEENMITTMSVTGHSAWGTLYTDLSGTISVNVKLPDGEKKMGIASAEAMRDDRDPRVRKASWEGIREAWLPHQETCAAVLNAITGWRAEMYEKRGLKSFLASSLHQNRMSNDTLNAMFNAIDTDGIVVGQKALRVQAKALGLDALHPWDLFAPAPVKKDSEKIYTFEEGINFIAEAVAEVDPEAGEFVRMMKDKKYIEATRGDTKRPGAYCTGFAKSRTPRVYLSDYNGGAQLLLTLAHELGHAFHSWVMRDLPQAQLSYPMNLAETASIFFETVCLGKLVAEAESAEERFNMLWGEAESAGAFFLNIPARFRFEEELNERRKATGPLSTDELDDMMVRAWKRYYGDCLTKDDMERVGVFSQSKLHFYLTGISFYNWPYSFGYMFALGVYARYQQGSSGDAPFSAVYRALLRDTGRMDAEDVVFKHLGARIDEPTFWKDAIAVAGAKVEQLQAAAAEINKA